MFPSLLSRQTATNQMSGKSNISRQELVAPNSIFQRQCKFTVCEENSIKQTLIVARSKHNQVTEFHAGPEHFKRYDKLMTRGDSINMAI